jgi:hypothetical protein
VQISVVHWKIPVKVTRANLRHIVCLYPSVFSIYLFYFPDAALSACFSDIQMPGFKNLSEAWSKTWLNQRYHGGLDLVAG